MEHDWSWCAELPRGGCSSPGLRLQRAETGAAGNTVLAFKWCVLGWEFALPCKDDVGYDPQTAQHRRRQKGKWILFPGPCRSVSLTVFQEFSAPGSSGKIWSNKDGSREELSYGTVNKMGRQIHRTWWDAPMSAWRVVVSVMRGVLTGYPR